jgi:hypothetical protein
MTRRHHSRTEIAATILLAIATIWLWYQIASAYGHP